MGNTPQAAIMSNNSMSSKSQRVKKESTGEISNHLAGSGAQENADSGFAATSGTGDSTVVHKDRNGTITVQSTKTVGKSNYSFVSVSPT